MTLRIKPTTPIFLSMILFGVMLFSNQKSDAQILCFEEPSTAAEYAACNRDIAHTFAPVIHQAVNTTLNLSLYGDSDRISSANFDGDWTTNNNWENAWKLAPHNSALPMGYYHVMWTDNFWIVTYTFYWARDYARSIFGACNADYHEGDADKVLVIIARPTSPNTDASTLTAGVIVSRHGHEYSQSCDDLVSVSDSDPFIGGGATHTVIGSAAGSHALFLDHTAVYPREPGLNPCRPHAQAEIRYLPGTSAVKTSIWGFSTERYTLEDVLVEGGLWDRRWDSQTFPAWGQFGCNNYCDGPGRASAPWNGDRGSNPIALLEDFNINCDCRDVTCDQGNGTIAFNDVDYVYNPYLCDEQNPFSIYGSKVICGNGQQVTLTVSTTADIVWNIPSQFVIVPSLPGAPANSIRIKVANNTPAGTYDIQAVEELGPCFARNTHSIEVDGNDSFNPFISGDIIFCTDNMMKVAFSIGNSNYPLGTTFSWSFFGGVPSTSTNATAIVTRYSYGPIWAYLTVTLPCSGGTISRSLTVYPTNCDIQPRPIRVSPNPANNEVCIYLGDIVSKTSKTDSNVNFAKLRNQPLAQLDASIESMDVSFIKDGTVKYNFTTDQSLHCMDVSGLTDGLYQVITQYKGKTISTNFVKINE